MQSAEKVALPLGLRATYVPRSRPLPTRPAPPRSLCGAPTQSGGSCRNPVASEGDQCTVHEPW